MVTLEDIENEIDPSKQTGIKNKIVARFKADFLNNLIKKLKKQEELLKEIPDVNGSEIIKALINGNRQLSPAEIDAAAKKFGTKGITMLEGMGSLNRVRGNGCLNRWDGILRRWDDMSILDAVFSPKQTIDPDQSERKQCKKYRVCVEDNPDERKYRCGKSDIISPNCKLSLSLEGLTHQQVLEIDLEIRNMLEKDGFVLR